MFIFNNRFRILSVAESMTTNSEKDRFRTIFVYAYAEVLSFLRVGFFLVGWFCLCFGFFKKLYIVATGADQSTFRFKTKHMEHMNLGKGQTTEEVY